LKNGHPECTEGNLLYVYGGYVYVSQNGRGPPLRFSASEKGVGGFGPRPGRSGLTQQATKPMQPTNSNPKKTYSSKTAVITIDVPGDDEARTVEATHFIKSDNGTVSIYQGRREDGIDIQTHISRCVIDRVDELPSHADAFGNMFDDVPEIGTDDNEGEGDSNELATDGDDQEDGDDDQELVADGGREIEPGDYVEHDGDRHRVARVGKSHCEIYQLGSVSEIVPISDVIAVPEVSA